MSIVNFPEARSSLSRPVESVESDAEREVIMVHNGKPAARLVAVGATVTGKRLGVAKGKFRLPGSIDEDHEEIARRLTGNR